MRWTECAAHVGEKKIRTKFWWEALKEEDPVGGSRHSWKDNIKMDLKKICWQDADRIYLVQNRDQYRAFVNMVMNLRVP
jgi:hypothetical protein